tara:strand:+ start:8926 stop:10836 length:1911 start_codon:yes stop_codon:yes gene_type:complete
LAFARIARGTPLDLAPDYETAWILSHAGRCDPRYRVVEPADHGGNDPDGHGVEEAGCGGDDEVAANPEAHMTFPTMIHTSVSQSLLTKIGRLSNGSCLDAIVEIIQNSRRAGATHIDITRIEGDRGPVLRIRDDGCGIADPAKFLTLGDSGWDERIARSEDSAGMGVFSLAGRHVLVRSHASDLGAAWQVTITPDAWESGEPLEVMPSSLHKGTVIEIDLPEAWAQQLEQAVKDAARFCPVAIWFGDKRLAYENFLSKATRVEKWNGCRIGIFADTCHVPRDLPRINFHGLTVPCDLPHIHDADGGRGWYAKVDIVAAENLKLVLPSRKEVVQGAALDALREACEAAIFRTIACEGHHRFAHADWLRAKDWGVSLPETAPWLHAWTPRTAEIDSVHLGDRVAGEPMILMPANPPHIEHCAGRAIGSGPLLKATPVLPVPEFAGYSWYDAIPCVLGCSIRIERAKGDVFDHSADGQVPPGVVSEPVDAIAVEFAARTTCDLDVPVEVLSLPADALIISGECSTDLRDVIILLATGCKITPAELADLLEDVCFYADEDCDSDSYHTQQAGFEMRARFTANMLLLGEDAAIIERVREALREHVSWLIPNDRAIRMHVVNHVVDAAFADKDDASAPAAAE